MKSGIPNAPDTALVRRIVLPLDGTPLAERAIQPAVVLARATGAEVVLVRCYEPSAQLPSGNSVLFSRGPSRGPRDAHLSRVPLHVASLYLARMEESLRSRGLRVHSRLYQWTASAGILEVACESSAGWVVMATRATNGQTGPAGQSGQAAPPNEQAHVAAEVLQPGVVPVLLLSPATPENLWTRIADDNTQVAAVDVPNGAGVQPYAALAARVFAGGAPRAGQVADISVANGSQTLPALAERLHANIGLAVLKGSLLLANQTPLRMAATDLVTLAAVPALVLP